jgi:hypothetical protein
MMIMMKKRKKRKLLLKILTILLGETWLQEIKRSATCAEKISSVASKGRCE